MRVEQLTPWSRVLEKQESHSAGQEIPLLLRNPQVHDHVHKSKPLAPILGHNYITLNYVTLYYIALHYIALLTFPGSQISQNDCRMWNMQYKYKNMCTVQLKFSHKKPNKTVITHKTIQKYIHIYTSTSILSK
jgi:hypothetical protein